MSQQEQDDEYISYCSFYWSRHYDIGLGRRGLGGVWSSYQLSWRDPYGSCPIDLQRQVQTSIRRWKDALRERKIRFPEMMRAVLRMHVLEILQVR